PIALFTSALDGSDRRLILSGGNGYPFMRSPAWSHDGREIAVVRSPGGTAGNIWLVPAQGGTPRRFTQDRPEVWSDWPTFAADDAGIVHTSNRGGATNLWIQLRDAAAPPIRLTTGAGPDTSPTVSRDGAVAFLNAHGRDELRIHDLTSGSTRGLLTHAPYMWS